MEQYDSSFVIKSEDFEKALIALKVLGEIPFVQCDELLEAETLDGALSLCRWEPVILYGDIAKVVFTGETEGGEDLIFEALAPFVKSGSSIIVGDETEKVWRWYFRNGVKRQNGEIALHVKFKEEFEEADEGAEDIPVFESVLLEPLGGCL